MSENKLPQIIILYGPPAAGKGTQAFLLKERLADYYHLDFGTELRAFVKEHIGDYNKDQDQINPNSPKDVVNIAHRIKHDMKSYLPVRSDDLRFVIEYKIRACVEKNQGIIIEGPGRLVEEAEWLSGFFAKHELEVIIFHLYISLNEVLRRSRTRYYIPSSQKSFVSLAAAKAACVDGEEPYRRSEDDNESGIEQRYHLLYADHFAEIMSIYQIKGKSTVFTVDATKHIDEVTNTIDEYFKVFYNFDI